MENGILPNGAPTPAMRDWAESEGVIAHPEAFTVTGGIE